jgi:hypothetical protein
LLAHRDHRLGRKIDAIAANLLGLSEQMPITLQMSAVVM